MAPESLPSVSVIVPVYNDPRGLRATVTALLEQTYPNDAYEILVVDNGSTDETYSAATELGDDHDRVTVLRETTVQSSYAARNAGIRNSAGDVLAFVDADVVVAEDWLVRSLRTLEAKNAEYLACDVRVRTNGPNASIAAEFDCRTGFPVQSYVEDREFAPTCCLFVRRSVFDSVGPFDSRFVSAGDLEFGNRVANSGRDLHFTAESTAVHPPRTTVRAHARKAFRVGRGRYQQRAFYPHRYGTVRSELLSPGLYLPVLPSQLRAGVRGWDELPIRRKVAFYLLATLLNWMRTYGRFREAWRQFHSARSVGENGGSS
jgi:glycosyltransferase involved in cell wall biosynthesis